MRLRELQMPPCPADFEGGIFAQEGSLDRLDQWFPPQVEIFPRSRQPGMPALPIPQYDHGVTTASEPAVADAQ